MRAIVPTFAHDLVISFYEELKIKIYRYTFWSLFTSYVYHVPNAENAHPQIYILPFYASSQQDNKNLSKYLRLIIYVSLDADCVQIS